jgi:signal transduction histidine kinase
VPAESPDRQIPDLSQKKSSTPGQSQKGGLTLIGYVYVQAPPDLDTGGSILPYIVMPGVLVLVLVVPVGLLFGLLTTRRLIGRVQRLAEVTTAVAAGDFRPRVAVTGRDEVGRLEDGFNRMTERLGESVEAGRRSAQTEARHAERSRIARELHDSISQDLFSLSLLAAGMRRAAPETLRVEAETMERTAARTMREMQAMLLELRPIALEDAGLVATLEELGRVYETRLGIRVRTTLEEARLTPACEHAVLRLVQEALGNAVKHAEPRVVDVRLQGGEEKVTVEVRDDGKGFDPDLAKSRHGMGLALMRERVEELGGGFALMSELGEGTVVIATLPVGEPS